MTELIKNGFFNIGSRSRLKLVWFSTVCIAILTGASIYHDMDAVATIGMGALAYIVQQYQKYESEHPSKNRN